VARLAAAGARVAVRRGTGVASFVRLFAPLRLAGGSLAEKASGFLVAHGAAFGLDDPAAELELRSEERDALGFSHLRYAQRAGGVEVFGGELRLHFDREGRLVAVNGAVVPRPAVDLRPAVDEKAARAEAAAAVAAALAAAPGGVRAAGPLTAGPARLVVFREGLLQGFAGSDFLAWAVEVGDGAAVRRRVLVDAHHGFPLASFELAPDILFRRLYEVSTASEIWTEGNSFPGALDTWQQNEVVVAGHVYHFFDNAFGRTSYDGADAEMWTVNNDPNISCPNARWNGSYTAYCTGTAADDVVAHEWGHAYTDYASDLVYAWQSGALNESASDVWGETIDLINGYQDAGEDLSPRSACGDSDRWRMGEDASAFGGAIRDLWNPNCNGDPGKVSDIQYVCASGDSGGVHSNSGVPNHLYALLVDGGSFNGQLVAALGFVKAAHVEWRAQSVYETPVTTFADHADALEAACADLVGIELEGLSVGETPAGPSGEMLSLADCQEVSDAIAAVELRGEACPGAFMPLLDPDAPDLCPETFGPADALREQFEAGLGDWTTSEVPTHPGTWEARSWSAASDLPGHRLGSAAYAPDPRNGDCDTDLENGILRLESPEIVIPEDAADARLAFDHWVSLENKWDGGNLKVAINGGEFALLPGSAFSFNPYNATLNTVGAGNDDPLAGEEAFTGADGGSVSGSWGRSLVDLGEIGVAPGDTVRLRFELGTDGCNGWAGWFVDDVRVYSCVDATLFADGFNLGNWNAWSGVAP